MRHVLEAAGLRFTRQRSAVFAYVHSVDSHPTAEQVYAAVRRLQPHIGLATVYKALEVLVSARLAAKLSTADGPARYDCRKGNHYHFRCLKTGRVHDLPTTFDPCLLQKLDPELVATLNRQGFHVTGYCLELLGYCQDQDG